MALHTPHTVDAGPGIIPVIIPVMKGRSLSLISGVHNQSDLDEVLAIFFFKFLLYLEPLPNLVTWFQIEQLSLEPTNHEALRLDRHPENPWGYHPSSVRTLAPSLGVEPTVFRMRHLSMNEPQPLPNITPLPIPSQQCLKTPCPLHRTLASILDLGITASPPKEAVSLQMADSRIEFRAFRSRLSSQKVLTNWKTEMARNLGGLIQIL